jgi:hypothetical protein
MAAGAWFHTDFDVPADTLTLPVDVRGGQGRELCILDEVVRGTAIVGRVTGACGAVAVKVRGVGEPLHVTVDIQLDDTATRWWADRIRPPLGQPELPRLVLLKSQGRLRGAAVLARRQGWRRGSGATATLAFTLDADELDRDGLLVVELADAMPILPGWAADRLSARGPVGLRIDRIAVRVADVRPAESRLAGPPPAGPPSAGPPSAGTAPAGATGCGFAVVEAGSPDRIRLSVQAVPPAPPPPRSPRNRWTRQTPSRAAFKVLRAGRRVAVRAAGVVPHRSRGGAQAVDLATGAPVDVQVLGRDAQGLDLRLAGRSTGPVLVALDDPSPRLSVRVGPAR